ncbi:MAG TPA: hypothetical protein VNT03_12285 [Baekduia sp.]|nr:hypothetical protein [Baekduia sp.]
MSVRGKDAVGNVGAPGTFSFTSFDPNAKAVSPPAGPVTPPTPGTGAAGTGATVPAAATRPLHATLGYTPTKRSQLLRRHTLTLTVACTPACSGRLRLALGRTILARVTPKAPRARHRVTVRLGQPALKAIRRHRGRTVVMIAATLRDAGGQLA